MPLEVTQQAAVVAANLDDQVGRSQPKHVYYRIGVPGKVHRHGVGGASDVDVVLE